jgi:hypothetical protein
MIFSDTSLNHALHHWANDPEIRERGCAHNLLFDERLSGARGAFFEATARHSPMSADHLRKSAIDYYRDHVRVSRGIPHSFMHLNAAAGIKTLAPELKLVRIEDLREPLEKTAIAPHQLIGALPKTNRPSQALLEWFIDQWNTRSDIRRNPHSFSAIKNQILREIGDPNWPELLRDKLGLDHFDATRNGDIPVALMEFEAGEILDQASATPGMDYPFCIPTALDCEPNPQFFPTPTSPGRSPGPLDFGCPMGLFVILTSDNLIAEVLHPRLTYKRENIAKVGFISAGLPDVDFKEMRNAHLWALRIEADRDDYGAEL